MNVRFVEHKRPNVQRVERLLQISEANNHWANSGPIWQMLGKEFERYLNLAEHLGALPCANGGIALEAMARLRECEVGRPIRWAVSAFSFRNLGRGFFSDATVIDCNENGLMDLEQLKNTDPDTYSGIVLVNPLGLGGDFERFFDFARRHCLPLIIDNAPGLGKAIPNWDWQVFSLHHTKPFGMGEGGLAIVPKVQSDAFLSLISYGDAPDDPSQWLNNGKISDISCAYLLDRLRDAPVWFPAYSEQRSRVLKLASELGLKPLAGGGTPDTPVTSLAFLAEGSLSPSSILQTKHMVLAKYYQPLRKLPVAEGVFQRIFNVPAHPTMEKLSDEQILDDLHRVIRNCVSEPMFEIHNARR
jgi:dTDP-4-amino-4,6-dideoxygalactose transaminase